MALELFRLQFSANEVYRNFCTSRGCEPGAITDWNQIPAIPTAAFKEMDLTALSPQERIAVFESSGTSARNRSRHYHSSESLAIYEASLLGWFRADVFRGSREKLNLLSLTPPAEKVRTSSLVHMFATIGREYGLAAHFVGELNGDGSWRLDFNAAISRMQAHSPGPMLIAGTAFNFVHLLDHCSERNLRLPLPSGSMVLETGGYKGRSRAIPKGELHSLIQQTFQISPEQIITEYGMSELSSQAYSRSEDTVFRFPPWVRVQIILPETGLPVGEGETGLIQICDLANVWSVMAVQTEDLGIRRGSDFELVGRTENAEPRGCSLMPA